MHLNYILILCAFFSIHCLDYEEYEYDKFNYENIMAENNICLASDKEIQDFFEKNEITYAKPTYDNHLRFMVGKCSPVILVPGIYSTKLQVKINCKDVMNYETTLYKQIKVFCGKKVCSENDRNDPDVTYDFWLSAIRPGFDMWREIKDEVKMKITDDDTLDENLEYTIDWDNRYGACLGFFLSMFNDKDECPVITKKEGEKEIETRICGHSQNIQISYGGGFLNKDIESDCGVMPVENILYSISLVGYRPEADVFKFTSDYLVSQGYEKGFSLAAVPNDFRKFISTNKFSYEALVYHVNRTYELTGKPVVIIAHSFGNLVTLDALNKQKDDKGFTSKIKKWISLAPPFAGASKATEYFLNGMDDFNRELGFIKGYLWFERFGQKIMMKSIPTIYELKPFSVFADLFEDEKYKEFAEAIRERITLEKNCRDTQCSMTDIENNSTAFNKYFKNYFPSLVSEDICPYESSVGGNNIALNKKCMLELFNIVDCPSVVKIKLNENNLEETVYNIDDYCEKEGEDLYYSMDCEKKGNKNCLDHLLTEVPYFYDKYNKERQYLIDRFNEDFSKQFGGETIDKNYFETDETIKKTIKEMTAYQKKISEIKDLPIPPVDIDIVFSTFNPTLAAEFVNGTLNMLPKTKGGPVNKGGDGTVPSWSPVLTGLKWIYEKEKYNLEQNIRLVQYCSRLGNVDTKLPNFLALQCRCLDTTNNVYLDNLDDCSHQKMLNDEYLMLYVRNIIYETDPAKIEKFVPSQIDAITKYNDTETTPDYLRECNHKLATLIYPDQKQKCIDISINKDQYNNNYCGKQGYDVTGKGYECCSVHVNGINDHSESFDDYDCYQLKPEKEYINYFKDILKSQIKLGTKYTINSVDIKCESILVNKSPYLKTTKILLGLIMILLL